MNSAIDTINQKFERMRQREKANREFFAEKIPVVHKKVSNPDVNIGLQIDQVSADINILRPNTKDSVYPTKPVQFCLDEVKSFMSTVRKSRYTPRYGVEKIPHLIKEKAFKKSIEFYDTHSVKSSTNQPKTMNVVIFGVGLGYHVEALANSKAFRSITIVENDVSNFIASMYCIDWKAILNNLPLSHSISFILNDGNSDYYKNELKAHFANLYPELQAATVRYNHAPYLGEYSEEKKILEEYAHFVNVVSEKVGPDGQRNFNSLENLRLGAKFIDLDRSNLKHNKPIAVIGAGPSLDIYKDILKENRDRLFIISAGTGLSSLLALDIQPDAHLELEYKKLASDILEHVSTKYSLKDIPLFGSIECHPDMTKLFKSYTAFGSEASGFAHTHPNGTLIGGGVNCVNAAVSLASRLTNSDIYLFGTDFAYTNDQHHSKSNVSRYEKLPENIKVLDKKYASGLNVTDTKGGVVATSVILNTSRLGMEHTLVNISNQVFNCSYGATIEGAKFIDINDISLTETETCLTLETIDVDYQDIKKAMINKWEIAFNLCKQVRKSLIENNTKLPLYRLIRAILNEIYRLYKNDLNNNQLRIFLSTSKLPIQLLHHISNFLRDEDVVIATNIWLKEYTEYLEFLEETFNSLLHGDNHYVQGEWTTY